LYGIIDSADTEISCWLSLLFNEPYSIIDVGLPLVD
jgi:NADH-ubiquinone/plastoquinone oxidoreductase, chain 3